MSLVTFTGASQFTFVSVLGRGRRRAAAALPPALLLAGRNTIYALSLRAVLRGGPLRRAVDAHLVIDESTAMAHAQRDRRAKRRAFLAHRARDLRVLERRDAARRAGRAAGSATRATLGLDAIFPAIFLALLVPQVRDRAALGAALLGAAIALALLPFTPAGVPVMAAVLGCVRSCCAGGRPDELVGRARAVRAPPTGSRPRASLLAGRVAATAGAACSLELVVVPVLAALILVQTLDGGRAIVLDARLPALLVAAVPGLAPRADPRDRARRRRDRGAAAPGRRLSGGRDAPRTREERVRGARKCARYGSDSEYAPRPCVAAYSTCAVLARASARRPRRSAARCPRATHAVLAGREPQHAEVVAAYRSPVSSLRAMPVTGWSPMSYERSVNVAVLWLGS